MTPDSDIFRAIAHPARREIIGLLATRQMSIGDVASQFDMTRPAVAKHLGILRDAGLVTTHKAGREMLNRLNAQPLETVAEWLAFYNRFWDTKLNNLKRAVEGDND